MLYSSGPFVCTLVAASDPESGRRLFHDLESLSNMDLVQSVGAAQKKKKLAEFAAGDSIKVHSRVTEGNKERIQVFEGIVTERKLGGLSETFTVRRIAHGVGVERSFLIHSPRVEKVDVLRRGLVRRAKLYYLQDRVGSKATRIKEKK
jgi:large subunit ribosomal protein L19